MVLPLAPYRMNYVSMGEEKGARKTIGRVPSHFSIIVISAFIAAIQRPTTARAADGWIPGTSPGMTNSNYAPAAAFKIERPA